MRGAYRAGMLPHAITTRSLLAQLEAKRRADAALRWSQSFPGAPAASKRDRVIRAPRRPR